MARLAFQAEDLDLQRVDLGVPCLERRLDPLRTGPFLGVIPAHDYSVVYRSPHVVDWHEAEGVRPLAILKLSVEAPP